MRDRVTFRDLVQTRPPYPARLHKIAEKEHRHAHGQSVAWLRS